MKGYHPRRRLLAAGATTLSLSLVLGGSAALARQETPMAGMSGVIDLRRAPVALHDGSCASPVVEPEFELGDLAPEPYTEVYDDFVRDALDEDVPADVRAPGVAPRLIDEDLDDDGVLDADEDLDDDGVIDAGFDEDGDGILDEAEIAPTAGFDADAALILIDLPTVYTAEEAVDATFDEIFGEEEAREDEDEDDDALDNVGLIAVHASSENYGTIVACGELTAPESDVVIGIQPVAGSGVYGFAVFQRDTGNLPIFGENTTGVNVYLFQNLSTARTARMAEATPTP